MTHGLISTAAPPRGAVSAIVAALERSHALACAALVLLSLALFLPGFVSLPPMDRDEPRFAQASKQMLETHDFVAIRFQDEARNKKPVGIYWLQAGSVALAETLGVERARELIYLYRIPSLFGAVAAVLLVYWAGLAWLDRRFAILAAALFAATLLLGVEARLAKTDAVLTATVVAAMGALARLWTARGGRALEATNTAYIFWIAVAVGGLVKGPIVLMVAGLAWLALSIKERSARWSAPLASWAAIGLALLIVAPWFVAIAIETHGAFFSEAVGTDMLAKVSGAREAHGAPPGSYLAAALVTLWPLAPLAVITGPGVWRARRDNAVVFLLAWLVPSWLVFEAVPTKLPHYVLPLYPAVALLVALMAQRGALAVDRTWKRVAIALLPLLPLLLALATPYAILIYGDRIDPAGVVAMTLAAVVAALAALALARGRLLLGAAGGILAAIVVVVAAYELAVPRLTAFALSPRLAAVLATAPCKPERLASAGFNEPSLVFLTRTDLRLVDGAAAARLLAEPGCAAAFVDIRQEAAFAQALAGARPPKLLGRVFGVNLNGGRHMDIGVYTNGG